MLDGANGEECVAVFESFYGHIGAHGAVEHGAGVGGFLGGEREGGGSEEEGGRGCSEEDSRIGRQDFLRLNRRKTANA